MHLLDELGVARRVLPPRGVRELQCLAIGDPQDTVDEPSGADWRIAPVPQDLMDRRVEITGPTDKKMTINALNSGANVWLADFEDANTPLWDNMITGQLNSERVALVDQGCECGVDAPLDRLPCLDDGLLPQRVLDVRLVRPADDAGRDDGLHGLAQQAHEAQ